MTMKETSLISSLLFKPKFTDDNLATLARDHGHMLQVDGLDRIHGHRTDPTAMSQLKDKWKTYGSEKETPYRISKHFCKCKSYCRTQLQTIFQSTIFSNVIFWFAFCMVA